MAKAAIYARFSSSSQRDASIDDQIRVCTDFATREGDVIVQTYREPAKSATSASGRPVFLRMIAEAKNAEWTKIYVWKQDRFARNRYDATTYKHELARWGVQLISATEPNADGNERILIDGLLESLAEYQSAQLGENVRRGLDGNAILCRHNGVAMYGYDLGEDGFYHVSETEGPIVKRMFEMVADGASVPEVLRMLEPYRGKHGKKFRVGRVTSIIRNVKYKGTYTYGDHVVEYGMEAIVSEELFERANAKLSGKRKRTAYDYYLSGKVYDREGRRFVGTSAHGKGGTYLYYRVQETGESYRKELVEDAVSKAVSDFLSADPKMREAIVKAVMDIQEEAIGDEARTAEAMRKRLADIDREADNLVDLIAKTGATERLAARLTELEEEQSSLSEELHEVERSAPVLTEEMLVAAMDAIMALEAPMPIVESFVQRVVIEGREMTITFNVSEPPQDGDGGSRELPSGPDGPTGRRASSRRYSLVDQIGPYKNFVAFVVTAWTFSIVVRWR